MSGVSPDIRPALGSAPAASSFSVIAGSGCAAAAYNGVAPNSLAAFAFAPARRRRSAISRSLRVTAQTNAAVPSAPAAACLAPPFNRDCTVARSPCFAAVTSDILPAPAASAVPANIIEVMSAARIVALMFIAILPLGSSFVCRQESPVFSGTLAKATLGGWQVQPARAVAQLLHVRNICLVQHGQEQI